MAATLRFAGRSRGLTAPCVTEEPPDASSIPPVVVECRRGLERAVQGALRLPFSLTDHDPVLLAAVSRAYRAAPAGRRAVTAALADHQVQESASADVATWALRLRAAYTKHVPNAVSQDEEPELIARTCDWNADASRQYDRLLTTTTQPADAAAAGGSGGGGGGGGGASIVAMRNSQDTRLAAASSPAPGDHLHPSWLHLRCSGLAVAGDSGCAMSGAELALSVLNLLLETSRSADDLQGDLFDLFGGDFDAVQDVLLRRDVLVRDADAIFAACSQAEELRAVGYSGTTADRTHTDEMMQSQQRFSGSTRGKRGRNSRRNPGTAATPRESSSVNSVFTVTDAREVASQKERFKAEQRAVRAGLIPSSFPDDDSHDDEDVLLPNLGGSAMAEVQKAFPGIALEGRTMIGGVDRLGLPLGATRKVGKGYEEIQVPPPSTDTLPPARLVNVPEALAKHSELLQAMAGVSTLNRLQSAVFPAAFKSNENLLVCAPTGAGKTNVALLTILREIVAVKEHRQHDFKVVYVAPMKALAAEVVEKFSARLRPLKLLVREFTGDMSLTRKEAIETHVLVTTPEKWDVVTRKSGSELSDAVTLFIIDEIHLLHDDRGAVLESIVARTLRLSEAAQRVIRLVGLSATLPNYEDVASFMRVNPRRGLFHFDGTHRPVPLMQNFIGVSEGGTSNSGEARNRRAAKMTAIAWDKVKDVLHRGHQAMIFVHSRKATSTTARDIIELSAKEQSQELLLGDSATMDEHSLQANESGGKGLPTWASKEISKSRTQDIREYCSKGVGIHHAGLPRPDRKLVEKLFAEGAIRLLCCTATLAWGVNLPARAVIILGTDVYDAQKGGFVQLGMLDVMQIFGRAGRPQFDTEGEGTIITKHENLARYLNLLTSSIPIESTLGSSASVLADHLNAEIVSGTVSSIGDGVTWLSYTYLSVRMSKNPLVYGIDWDEVAKDPGLHSRRAVLIEQAARALDDARMCRYDPRTGSLAPTDLGRVSSHFYVSHRTVVLWNELLAKLSAQEGISDDAWEEMDATVLHAVSCASEFEQMRSREEELEELDSLSKDACCVKLRAGPESREGKVNILLQSFISRASVRMSDLSYVVQSSTRLLRALFEVALRRGLPSLSLSALEMARASESQVWPFQHPLWQFCNASMRGEKALVHAEILDKLDDVGHAGELHALRDMDKGELTSLLQSPRYAATVFLAVRYVPTLDIVKASVAPITRTVLRVSIDLIPSFTWKDNVHGNAESWWLWIEDHEHERIYHSERILLSKRQVQGMTSDKAKSDPEESQCMSLNLTVPVFDPPSAQYWVRVESERWHTGGGSTAVLSLHNLALPQREPPHTELLDLRPLRVASVLKPPYASLYCEQFSHFNPVQTQIFHPAYHTNENMLIGAPTGSGKTVMAELCMLRAFDIAPRKCVVYIAPLKALVRERMDDWKRRLGEMLGKKVIELTGDVGKVEAQVLENADVIVATPEKWDVVSRSWHRRSFVRNVSLLVLDEVHLLGADRGPILEVIVSRARRLSLAFSGRANSSEMFSDIKSRTVTPSIRIVALSTALANARELADWLGVSPSVGLFNFRPSVRPVPCEAHVIGVAGERYCPRMQAMNRPTYSAIGRYSATKPVLVFVSSRRQTRLTAIDLVRLAAADGRPGRFVCNPSSSSSKLEGLIAAISDNSLRECLSHGIGIHHAGLNRVDRSIVEELFADGYAQVLVSTSTLAWGVNLPAHLVVVKGTEYFDAKQGRYVDMPVTDILQMMGRAGRPQFDTQAYAVILVHEPKKTFLKKFLYEPFPVESSLHLQLSDHLNAEVAAGSIRSPQDAMDYLTWTYLFRRVFMNPGFYNVTSDDNSGKRVQPTSGMISSYFSDLVQACFKRLSVAGCITVGLRLSNQSTSSLHALSESSPRLLNLEAVSNVLGIVRSFASGHTSCDTVHVHPTALGQVAAHYYLSHKSIHRIGKGISSGLRHADVIRILAECDEFSELPVRPSEEQVNTDYANMVAESMVARGMFKNRRACMQALGLGTNPELPSSKVHLLLHGYLAQVRPPVVDFVADLRSVLDQSDRVLQAIVDVAAERGIFSSVKACVEVSQMLYQGRLLSLGSFNSLAMDLDIGLDNILANAGFRRIFDLLSCKNDVLRILTDAGVSGDVARAVYKMLERVPCIQVAGRITDNRRNISVSITNKTVDLRSPQTETRSTDNTRAACAATNAKNGRMRDESWIVLVSEHGTDCLVAVKRLGRVQGNGGMRTVNLLLNNKSSSGCSAYDVTVMSDVYIGIDQVTKIEPQRALENNASKALEARLIR